MVAAADAPAKLVQLRQPEFVGAVDDDGVGVGDVDAGFDDGGTEQHVESLLQKVAHDLFQLALAQLSVRYADAGFGQQGFQPLAHVFNRIHFIVQEKHLPAAFEFAQHGFAHAAFAERFDKGFDGEAAAGRGGNQREVAQAFERHAEGARNRRGGHGEDIDIGAQAFELLFLAHAEAVFFINNH